MFKYQCGYMDSVTERMKELATTGSQITLAVKIHGNKNENKQKMDLFGPK